MSVDVAHGELDKVEVDAVLDGEVDEVEPVAGEMETVGEQVEVELE